MRPEVKNMISAVTSGDVAAPRWGARAAGRGERGAAKACAWGSGRGGAGPPRPLSSRPRGARRPAAADWSGTRGAGPWRGGTVVAPAVMIFRTSQYRPGSGTADRYPFAPDVVVDS